MIQPQSAQLLHPDTARYDPMSPNLITTHRYPLMSLLTTTSLIEIATWVLIHGTPEQKDMVKGTVDMALR